jgi:hypothetical protein
MNTGRISHRRFAGAGLVVLMLPAWLLASRALGDISPAAAIQKGRQAVELLSGLPCDETQARQRATRRLERAENEVARARALDDDKAARRDVRNAMQSNRDTLQSTANTLRAELTRVMNSANVTWVLTHNFFADDPNTLDSYEIEFQSDGRTLDPLVQALKAPVEQTLQIDPTISNEFTVIPPNELERFRGAVREFATNLAVLNNQTLLQDSGKAVPAIRGIVRDCQAMLDLVDGFFLPVSQLRLSDYDNDIRVFDETARAARQYALQLAREGVDMVRQAICACARSTRITIAISGGPGQALAKRQLAQVDQAMKAADKLAADAGSDTTPCDLKSVDRLVKRLENARGQKSFPGLRPPH